MGELTANLDAIVKFSVDSWAMSAQIDSAFAAANAGGPAVLSPVFGLVGAQFLATFAQVQAVHADAIAHLGETALSIGTGAATAATSYGARDSATALGLSIVRDGLAP